MRKAKEQKEEIER